MIAINQNIKVIANEAAACVQHETCPNDFSGWAIIQTIRIFIILIFAVLTIQVAQAAQRTWSGLISTDWNTAGNWGGTVPISTDTVIIQTGIFNCLLAANTTIKQFTLTSDTIDLNGYVLTVTNNATTTAGLITNGTVTINGSGVVTFNGGTISVIVNATAASIKFSGGTFNNAVTAVKKGSTSSTGNGNCTFTTDVTLIDSSTSNWTFANTTADSWNGKVVVKQTSSGIIYFAHNNGTANSFSKSVTFTNTSTGTINCDYYGNSTFHDSIIVNGTSSGMIRFGIGGGKTTLDTSIIAIGSSGFSSTGILHLGGILQNDATKTISLTTTGTTKLQFDDGSIWYGTVTASAPYMKCNGGRFLGITDLTYTTNNTSASAGGTYFGGVTTLSRNATGSGTFSLGTTYTDTFATTTTIKNLNAGNVSIANAKFNGKVIFKNQSGGGTDRFFIAEGGTCTFKDSVTFDNTSSGMRIGSGGSAVFDTSSRINILSTFTNTFKVYNVTQNGTSAVNFPFQNNTDILSLNSGNTFSGPVSIYAQRVQLNSSTFNNTFYLKRTGSGTDTCMGGNFFNGTTTTIIDSNASTHSFSMARTYADDFNGDVSFKQYGTNCKLYPAYTKNSTFAGNLTVDGSSAIEFGANGGKVILDGSGVQTLSKTASYVPSFKRIQINKSAGIVSLAYPLTLADTLFLTNGVLATDTTNLLTVPDNGIISGSSDLSYINGPVKKIGNDLFFFPTGDTTLHSHPYHPLQFTTIPADITDAFTAQYFGSGSGVADDNSLDTIDVSTCEYWKLKNNNGSSGIKIGLWYNSSCPVGDINKMVVMDYDGTHWQNEGSSGTGAVVISAVASLIPAGRTDILTIGVHPALDTIVLSGSTINKWEKYEIAFKLPPLYEQAVDSFFNHYYVTGGVVDTADLNPYADDSLAVRVDLLSPSNRRITKWAFFMREAAWSGTDDEDTLIADTSMLAGYHWHFRFAPDTIGSWQYSITVSTPLWPTPLPTYTFGIYFFTDTNPLPDNHGYLKAGSNNQFLKFEDGTPFFGIGENLMGDHGYWGNHSKWQSNCDNHFYRLMYENFRKTLKEMHEVGANLVRNVFWRNTFAFDRNNLGVYDRFYNTLPVCPSEDYVCSLYTSESGNMQYHIRMLDSLVEKAREENVYLVLYPQASDPRGSGQSFNWGDNAYIKYLYSTHNYNSVDSIDSIGYHYYSDPLIRYYDKRAYKYLLSRWGYSVNLAMIQPIGEADGIYGYTSKIWMVEGNCSNRNQYMPYIAGLRDSINSWLNDVIGYVKTPVDSGGLGEDKHLYLLTYLGLPWIDTTNYGNHANYYSLMNNDKIDINGLSSYWDNKKMMLSRSNLCASIKSTFAQKPFHISEGSSHGHLDSLENDTYAYYNNYDVSFHNEIWAGAFMGNTSTINTWDGEVVHRWKWATPDSLGEAFQMDVHDSVSPFSIMQINDTIKSCFHNFKRLSEFTSLIDFNQDYVQCIYYGDSVNNIESYYLKSTDTARAYGWVHNINEYWGKSYYYKLNGVIYEDFFGCDTLPQPDTLFQLPGFKQSHTYYLYFFWTRLGGQTVPPNYTVITDNSGNITIDLSSSPLGCDSTNADYAFMISESPWNNQRLAFHKKDQQTGRLDVRISPNPSYGIFKVSVIGEELINWQSIEVMDISGKIILKSELPRNSVSLNLSDKTKGIYFLIVRSSNSFIVKKIILL